MDRRWRAPGALNATPCGYPRDLAQAGVVAERDSSFRNRQGRQVLGNFGRVFNQVFNRVYLVYDLRHYLKFCNAHFFRFARVACALAAVSARFAGPLMRSLAAIVS